MKKYAVFLFLLLWGSVSAFPDMRQYSSKILVTNDGYKSWVLSDGERFFSLYPIKNNKAEYLYGFCQTVQHYIYVSGIKLKNGKWIVEHNPTCFINPKGTEIFDNSSSWFESEFEGNKVQVFEFVDDGSRGRIYLVHENGKTCGMWQTFE